MPNRTKNPFRSTKRPSAKNEIMVLFWLFGIEHNGGQSSETNNIAQITKVVWRYEKEYRTIILFCLGGKDGSCCLASIKRMC